MKWHEISNDPNAPEVLAARRETLKRAQASSIKDRVSYLCDLARGKRVLDVGVVDHFLGASSSAEWLHGKLCEVATTCIGVDVLKEEVAKLRHRGYDVRAIDLTRVSLPEKFDLIVMGEVIEHVDEPGGLLRNVASMLVDDGLLVLTTPNPWYVNVFVKNLLGSTPFTDSADHVSWYDASTLYEIGQRCGLELSRYADVQGASPRSVLGQIFFRMSPALIGLGVNRFLFAKTIIYEFRLSTANPPKS